MLWDSADTSTRHFNAQLSAYFSSAVSHYATKSIILCNIKTLPRLSSKRSVTNYIKDLELAVFFPFDRLSLAQTDALMCPILGHSNLDVEPGAQRKSRAGFLFLHLTSCPSEREKKGAATLFPPSLCALTPQSTGPEVGCRSSSA